MEIVRLFLTPDEVVPPYIRYDPDTDAIQISPDNGVTWNDDIGADPRHADGYRMPPLGGASPRCDAAANMVAALRGFVDTIINTLDYLALVNAAAGILARFIGLIGWLISLVLAIIDGLLVIGRSTIDTAFTEAVYDDILCIIYCRISNDGRVSASQLAAINDDILDQLGATVSAVWEYTMTGLGEVGLSNAGAIGTETGDCGDCGDCGGCAYDFDLDGQGFIGETWGTYANVGTYDTYPPSFPDGFDAGYSSGNNEMAIKGSCPFLHSRGYAALVYLTAGASGTLDVGLYTNLGVLIARKTVALTGGSNAVSAYFINSSTYFDDSNVVVRVGYAGTYGYGAVLQTLDLTF